MIAKFKRRVQFMNIYGPVKEHITVQASFVELMVWSSSSQTVISFCVRQPDVCVHSWRVEDGEEELVTEDGCRSVPARGRIE